jgi:hypothetical protein
MSSLAEISRPYLGVYSCTALRLGERDCLTEYQKLDLTLEYGGEFLLSWKTETAGGEKRGRYEVHDKFITLTAEQDGKTVCETFPMEKGTITVERKILSRTFFAQFKIIKKT